MLVRKHLKPAASSRKSGGPRWVRRWHRRLGIGSALAVVLLSITGIMLNHIDRLYQSGDYVSSDLLLDWYDIGYPVQVVSNQQHQLASESANQYIWADGTLIHNGKALLFNQSPLIGLYTYQGIDHLFTQTDLHLFSSDCQFIESVSLADIGPIRQASQGAAPSAVLLTAATVSRVFDLNSLRMEPVSNSTTSNGRNLVGNLTTHADESFAHEVARRQMLLKSTVLLDLHSGRIFAKSGPLIMDLFAVCFLLLATTGIAAWIRQARRERKTK